MKYQEIIFECLNYIEDNIEECMTIEAVATRMGYSVYHFSRIFKNSMGISPKEYIQERKMVHAAKRLYEGEKIIDLAVVYGYETHSGFTKAFKKKFGITPSIIHMLQLSCDLIHEDKGRNQMAQNPIFIRESVDFKSEEVLYQELVETLARKRSTNDFNKLEEAYKVARKIHKGEKRKSGEDYIIHPLNVALILAEMELDENCIIAGLIHEVAEKERSVKVEDIEKNFHREIIHLIKATENLKITPLENLNEIEEKALLIKLADRLHNMRTIQYMEPERFEEKAKETIEIFSPIAAKLGIDKLKMELDDLALNYIK